MSTPVRFKDPLKTIESFGGRFLVICPACARCAQVYRRGAGESDIRFACPSCGRSEQWRGNRSVIYYRWGGEAPPSGVLCVGGAIDWYFHYPVWLATSCCGETLWAYNEQHLDYLQSYVAAALRERAIAPTAAGGIRNSSLASRLPGWLRAAKNRDRILAAITDLKARLPREHKTSNQMKMRRR